MLRLTKTEAQQDVFFLLCDHRSCMVVRLGPAIIANVEEYRLTKRQFIKAVIAEGWWIDFEVMYCPLHARDMLQFAEAEAEKGRQVVAPARPQDVLAFGRGL